MKATFSLQRLRSIVMFTVAFSAAASGSGAEAKKVVFTTSGTGYSPIGEKELAEFRAAAPSLTIVTPPRERLMAEIADAHAIIGRITPEMMRAAPKLEWVQVTSAGVENVLFPEMKNSRVVLTNMKIVQGPEIADHAFALLLALTRGINLAVRDRATETWNGREYRVKELRDKTAVIVGVGGIGTQIAVRAKAFGMRVIGVDLKDIPLVPYLDHSTPPDRLDSVLPLANVLFIAAPFTEKTNKMIRAEQFKLLKVDSYFICVSRGRIYDAEALAEAVSSGHLAGAGVDVTDPEPLPKGHPLWKLPNVIITPHLAGRSDGESARYHYIYRENLVRFANGEPLLNVVDKEAGF